MRSESCASLAWRYEFADGVAKDLTRARALYDKGCGGGSATACYSLGLLLEEKEPSSAAAIFQRGCEFGGSWGARSCAVLGRKYQRGNGVFKDAALAAMPFG